MQINSIYNKSYSFVTIFCGNRKLNEQKTRERERRKRDRGKRDREERGRGREGERDGWRDGWRDGGRGRGRLGAAVSVVHNGRRIPETRPAPTILETRPGEAIPETTAGATTGTADGHAAVALLDFSGHVVEDVEMFGSGGGEGGEGLGRRRRSASSSCCCNAGHKSFRAWLPKTSPREKCFCDACSKFCRASLQSPPILSCNV
jgi:hypothetical protein